MNVFIYNDHGANQEPIQSVIKNFFRGKAYIYFVNGEKIQKGILQISRPGDLLVMPGSLGSRMYAKQLGVSGIKIIREKVSQGLNYLGICAGACLAASKVIWCEGTKDEIIARAKNYETLGLLDITSCGPLPQIVGYEPLVDSNRKVHNLFNKAGSYFQINTGAKDVQVFASYANLSDCLPEAGAVVAGQCGKGSVLLFGPHPEYRLEHLLQLHDGFSHYKTSDKNAAEATDKSYALTARGVRDFFSSFTPIPLSTSLLPQTMKQVFGFYPAWEAPPSSVVLRNLSKQLGAPELNQAAIFTKVMASRSNAPKALDGF